MSDAIEAFPLAWPHGWRRSSTRTRAKFGTQRTEYSSLPGSTTSWKRRSDMTIAQGTERVLDSLQRMGIRSHEVVISSNLVLRNDGLPRSGQRAPEDPGVAVYWTKGKERRCIAIDRYDRVQDNLAAIAATLEAMRAIDRHGGAEILNRAFTGFTALPMPEQWWQVLGVRSNATREEIDDAYRPLAMHHHPDRGGHPAEMARINVARDEGYAAARAT